MPELHLPPGVRYTCIRCGECCRSLEVTLTEREHERLAARDWSREVADYSPERFFARLRRPRGSHVWRLRPHPGGGCRFLGDDNLCRVHAALGMSAKPFAGRVFPFTFTVTPVGVFVACRFNCPAVARGKGPPLEEQRRGIEQLFKEYQRTYSPPTEPERVRFFGRFELAWPDILRMEDQLLAFLLLPDLDMPRRLLACCRLVRRFVGQAVTQEEGRVGADPDAIVAELRRGVAESPVPSAIERVLMRLLVGSFVGATLPSVRELPAVRRAATRLGNLGQRLRLAVGRGRLGLPGIGEAVPFRDMCSVDRAAIDAASTAMLERYFVAKIASQSFFGGACFGRSFAEGVEFLATAYGVILWLAAAHAAAAGRRSLAADDVEYGVRQVDYAYNYLGAFGGMSERARAAIFWHWGTVEKILAGLSARE